MKEAGLCCGGGVLWKEREELLWDGLPERSSWNKKKQNKNNNNNYYFNSLKINGKLIIKFVDFLNKNVQTTAKSLWSPKFTVTTLNTTIKYLKYTKHC